MRVRVGNPFTTKMTKNNILNKELESQQLSTSVYNSEETSIRFTVDNTEVEVRLSIEELESMLEFAKKCKEQAS